MTRESVRLKQRGNQWYICKRVPMKYHGVESRRTIWISLHTDSERSAREKAPVVWRKQLTVWEAELAGEPLEASKRHSAAVKLAASMDIQYLGAEQLAVQPLASILNRIDMVVQSDGKVNKRLAEALLGGASEPEVATIPETVTHPDITIRRAFELYEDLVSDENLNKSADQLRRWKNPRVKAVENLVEVIGNIPISLITRVNMLTFRKWWKNRIAKSGVTANSANKDLAHLATIFNVVNERMLLDLNLPLGGLRLKSGIAAIRPPFSDGWIKDQLLRPGALDGMNGEARAILLIMVNTGCRPSEIAALSANTIRLEHKVPHISIQPEGRQVKTARAIRKVPLLGVSLAAARNFPDGFPRYQANSASLSGTVNKYLRENGLLESEQHSLYSLRHSFEDRMLAAEIDDRIRRDLFGHALSREQYGSGASLEQSARLLAPISF